MNTYEHNLEIALRANDTRTVEALKRHQKYLETLVRKNVTVVDEKGRALGTTAHEDTIKQFMSSKKTFPQIYRLHLYTYPDLKKKLEELVSTGEVIVSRRIGRAYYQMKK